jgi:hypothetical protein
MIFISDSVGWNSFITNGYDKMTFTEICLYLHCYFTVP